MKRFRTVEVSDPQFESSGLRFITVKTPNLKGRGDICVYVPEVEDSSDLPIVLLLHGVYGSAWCWSQKAGAHLTAERLIKDGTIKPMILVMPSDGLWGDGSGYLAHNEYNFENWIVDDVIDAVRENIEEAKLSSVTFISGLSMGGYGALRIGAKYGGVFKAISAHSAITSLPQMSLFVEEPIEMYVQDESSEEDVFQTIEVYKKDLPHLRFDCGKKDLLIKHNRTLHEQLLESNISHEYFEFRGGHEWPYWQKHLEDSLKYFNQYI